MRFLSATLAAGVACAACGAAPAAATVTPSAKAPSVPDTPVTLSEGGCQPSSFSLPKGTLIFTVTNGGSTKVEEMEIDDDQGNVRGDVEGVQPGETRSFVLTLTAGTYEVRCPETATKYGTLTVK